MLKLENMLFSVIRLCKGGGQKIHASGIKAYGMQNRFQFRSLILTFVTSLSIMRTASVSLSVERTGTAIMLP